MIPVTVDDLIVRVPKDGEVRLTDTPGHAPANAGPLRVVLLKEREGPRALPIWVGAVEGNAIALALAGIETPRPMSLSLMYRVLGMANIAIERVVVTALRRDIFYAVLSLRIDGQPREVDARPSDAITLALYAGAPVFVTPEMLELPVVGQCARRAAGPGSADRAGAGREGAPGRGPADGVAKLPHAARPENVGECSGRPHAIDPMRRDRMTSFNQRRSVP
jgi:bifunctional DNase/RNase